MTSFWSYLVSALVLANILACVWLLIWASRKRPEEAAEGAETGHVWDDDLREYNNPLPKWWLNLFVITVIFGLGYLALYPGLGNYRGYLGWSEHKQHDERLAKVMEKRAALLAGFEGHDIVSLEKDPAALKYGSQLFTANCSGCHGTDAHGAKGFPNLTDQDWLYGGAPDTVFTTITNGRNGIMPPLATALDEQKISDVIAYVQSLHTGASGAQVDAGHAVFMGTCMACHGPEAKGNPLLGAPNLSDDTWLYGGSADTIRETITYGRHGQMPAFGATLNDTERRLVAAYVLSLSSGE